MIKRGKVVLKNSAVVVVDIDGAYVQFNYNSGMQNMKELFVKVVNGKYSLTSEDEYIKEKNKQSKNANKTVNKECNTEE